MGAYLRSLETALRASASARDQALSTQLLQFDEPPYMPSMGDDPVRGERLRKAAEAAPLDHLVQWIWANAPDGASGCSAAKPCPGRGRALAALEPENGAAWIPAVARADDAHDVAATDDALAHMAAATQYDDKVRDLTQAWEDIVRRFPEPAASAIIPRLASGKSALATRDQEFLKSLVGMQGGSVLFSTIAVVKSCSTEGRCAADPRRSTYCAKAGRLVLDHGTTQGAVMMGAYALQSSGFATANDRERIRTAYWQIMQYTQLEHALEHNAAAARRFEPDTASDTEIGAMHEQLRRANVSLTPPAGWTYPEDPMRPVADCPR